MHDLTSPRTIAPQTAAALLAALVLLGAGGCGKSPEEQKAAVAAQIAQTTGRLVVKSNRANATVEATRLPAAGEAAPAGVKGAAGQTLSGLAPGKYAVVALSDGWPEVRGETSVDAGQTTEFELNFKSGSLRLDSDPTGATVRQGATVLGKTPLVIPQLPPGECQLTLEYPAWPVLALRTTVAENVESAETVRLPHGRLVVASVPAGATVLHGKRSLGVTPFTLERFPAGTTRLTLQAKDFPPLQVAVTVEDRGETKVGPELGTGFPLLDPAALLRAIWVPENKDRITESFDATGRYAPQNGIVKNLDRKKLHLDWLGKRYRFTGVVKAYNAKAGQIEFVEDKSELSQHRVLAKLSAAALDDPAVTSPTLKGATLSLYGLLTTTEEPRWPSKVITFELSGAELLQSSSP